MGDRRNIGSAALAGLVGSYGSGDSSDESGDEKLSNKTHSYVNNSIWSVCMDQATGCPYYWNQITNEVSWEAPPSYMANSVNQYQGSTNSTTAPIQPMRPNSDKNKPKPIIANMPKVINSSTNQVKRSKKSNSSDEDEKIELITSYYNSDSASGDDNTEESNKPKSELHGILKKPKEIKPLDVKKKVVKPDTTMPYGPELPKKFLKTDAIEPPKSTLFPAFQEKIEDPIINCELIKDPIILNADSKSLMQSTNEVSKDETVSINDDKSNLNNSETVSNPDKSSTPLETENLEKLMSTQANLLKKLGKLDPNEIKYLNGSTANSPIMNSRTHSPIGSPGGADSPLPMKKSNALDMDVDDLIAQIEMEQPIDQPVVSDALSNETNHSQDGSVTNKSIMITEDSSESKIDHTFKPLFPIQESSENGAVEKQVDNADNSVVEKSMINKYEVVPNEDGIENSAFKRKRRIALDIFSNKKHIKSEDALQAITFSTKYSNSEESAGERKGLGFKMNEESPEGDESRLNYLNFKKGEAILFQKGDVLNPADGSKEDKDEKEGDDNNDDMDEKKKLIEAKLKFLVQSLPPVPPVQQLFIELQTLWGAMSSGALQSKHMHEWLHTANSTLGRLEASAAPDPWICRFHSAAGCYVYEHAETGQWQWEFPEPEVPPPPPTPPAVKPPSPPPDEPTDMDISTTPPPQFRSDDAEPLPPGVEISYNSPLPIDGNLQAQISHSSLNSNHLKLNDNIESKDILCAELDSFYSDIAALEEPVPPSDSTNVEKPVIQTDKPKQTIPTSKLPDASAVVKDKEKEKKKKIKVKTPNSMKNKNVSKLVAKWKKVQESLDD